MNSTNDVEMNKGVLPEIVPESDSEDSDDSMSDSEKEEETPKVNKPVKPMKEPKTKTVPHVSDQVHSPCDELFPRLMRSC